MPFPIIVPIRFDDRAIQDRRLARRDDIEFCTNGNVYRRFRHRFPKNKGCFL